LKNISSIGRRDDPAGVTDASFFTCRNNISQLEITDKEVCGWIFPYGDKEHYGAMQS
jgi:hypothetical protein